jgi:excisionase family DNA binding protein
MFLRLRSSEAYEQAKKDQSLVDWLTTRDVARILKVHVTSVRRWSQIGVLKSYRIGPRGHRRYLRKDIFTCLHKSGSGERTEEE